MYFSSINNTVPQTRYPAVIERVLKYLRETNLAEMDCGVYELEGRKLYVQLFETETGSVAERKPESHKQYLDVQFLVSGAEAIGCTPYKDSYEVSEDLLAERDLLFYKEVENETFIKLVPGCFAVFFPDDVHRPACQNGEAQTVRKAVVKVHTDLL